MDIKDIRLKKIALEEEIEKFLSEKLAGFTTETEIDVAGVGATLTTIRDFSNTKVPYLVNVYLTLDLL
jgi:hypothetical protein